MIRVRPPDELVNDNNTIRASAQSPVTRYERQPGCLCEGKKISIRPDLLRSSDQYEWQPNVRVKESETCSYDLLGR